jgi:hypothetical protein
MKKFMLGAIVVTVLGALGLGCASTQVNAAVALQEGTNPVWVFMDVQQKSAFGKTGDVTGIYHCRREAGQPICERARMDTKAD